MALIETRATANIESSANTRDTGSEDIEVVTIDIDDDFSVYPVLEMLEIVGKKAGLNKIQIQETDIALRELISNVIKHGGGKGQVRLIFSKINPNGLGVEVEDWGKGIDDFYKAMEDGYTTGSGLGGGLPAVNRLMDSFKLVSRPNTGTLFYALKKAEESGREDAGEVWKFSVFSRPAEGESENGDGFFIKRRGKKSYIYLIDGLGHGHDAHKAADITVKLLEQYYIWPHEELINLLHEKLKHTRGIALSTAIVDDENDYISYTGVGNITAAVLGENNETMMNYNGTIGGKLRKVKTFEYPYSNGDLFVMYSDGILLHWLKDYENYWKGILQDFAYTIFNKFNRGNDDATLIVGSRR